MPCGSSKEQLCSVEILLYVASPVTTKYAVAVVARNYCVAWKYCAHCQKRLAIFPSPAGMSLTTLSLAGNDLPNQTKLSLAGKIKLFSARESLVRDIPTGDGKIANLFYSVFRPGRNNYVVATRNN